MRDSRGRISVIVAAFEYARCLFGSVARVGDEREEAMGQACEITHSGGSMAESNKQKLDQVKDKWDRWCYILSARCSYPPSEGEEKLCLASASITCVMGRTRNRERVYIYAPPYSL